MEYWWLVIDYWWLIIIYSLFFIHYRVLILVDYPLLIIFYCLSMFDDWFSIINHLLFVIDYWSLFIIDCWLSIIMQLSIATLVQLFVSYSCYGFIAFYTMDRLPITNLFQISWIKTYPSTQLLVFNNVENFINNHKYRVVKENQVSMQLCYEVV